MGGAGHVDSPGDLCSVNLENRVFLTENGLPQLLILLENVLERGVLLRLLLGVAVISLVLGIAYECHDTKSSDLPIRLLGI